MPVPEGCDRASCGGRWVGDCGDAHPSGTGSRYGTQAGGRGMSAFLTLLKRDILLAAREGGALGTALGFYLIVVALMPLGLGPDLNLLARIAAGVLWIALLLAALLSLNRIFESAY